MDFGYTQEEEEFRVRLCNFLDRELTEEIARQNWEDKGVGPEAREFSRKLGGQWVLGDELAGRIRGTGLISHL